MNEVRRVVVGSQSASGSGSIRLRPFFSYYGGKWRDAPRNYPAPTHNTIVEPFAGSAGYSLRYPDRKVTLCDLDPTIVGVWEYLIRVSAAEVLAIPDVGPSETVDDLGICQEARWLVGFWLNRAVARPVKSPSRWMREGGHENSFWGERVRQTIASQLDSIRHWRVKCDSYESLSTGEPATWFVDPPYKVAGKHYRHGASGIDYADLGSWCSRLPGQVIVCENAGATWLPFIDLAESKTTRAGKTSKEVRWLSAA